MGSQANFGKPEDTPEWQLDATMPFDETGPSWLDGVDFPLIEDQGHQYLDPGLFSNNNLHSNSQANVVYPLVPFGSDFSQPQSNNNWGMTNTPCFNQSNETLFNQGSGYLSSQPATQLQRNLPYNPQPGWPGVPQTPNHVPSQHVQFPQQIVPRNVQGRGQDHAGQFVPPPLFQDGQQYTQALLEQYPQQQPRAPRFGAQPKTHDISAEELKQKLKEPGTNNFKLIIKTLEQSKQCKKVYLSLGDVDKKDREDILGREEELIGRLYSAIRHSVHVEESGGQAAESPTVGPADLAGGQAQKKRKRAGTKSQSDAAVLRLSPAVLQMVCWELLEAIIDAQAGTNQIPAWYTAKPHGYGKFENFDRRFEAVEEVLQNSKIMCKSLLDGHEWHARIAWNPIKEALRKSSNKMINKERSILLKAGNEVIRRQRDSEHNDVHNMKRKLEDSEFKVEDSELPSKAVKACADDTESLSNFDFTLSPTNSDLQRQYPSLPIGEHSLMASNAAPLFTGTAQPFTSATQSSTGVAQPFTVTAQSPLDYDNSPRPPTDPFDTGAEESHEDFFSRQESYANLDWTGLFDDEAAQ